MKPVKVVTFGRSSQNDVVLSDSKASRTHCQIIQYSDGSFAIADFGSTNGTFVNGRRIRGQASLRLTDSVHVAGTELFWQKYFIAGKAISKKRWLWPTVAASTALVIGALIFVLLSSKVGLDQTFAFEGEYPDAVTVELTDKHGASYTVEAIEGQVCIWFNEGVSCKEAISSIDKVGGEVLAQIPNIGYYLVKVPTSDVNTFLSKIEENVVVERAFPNMVSYPCMANNYILDNFNAQIGEKDTTPHGLIVQFAMEECGSQSTIKPFNIGTSNGKSMCTGKELDETCANSAVFALNSISKEQVDGPIIINMSYGPYLRKRANKERYYWDDATDEEKEDYKRRYVAFIQNIIENVKPLKGRDFVIVKSAGNNGVKEFETAILSYMRSNLSPEELEMLDNHFLIVAAKDERRTVYSNELEYGINDSWVTKVDITDFWYGGKYRHGTSYASPRAACFLSSAVNDYGLKASEVLKYAREATRLHPEHLLTEAMLDSVINAEKKETVEPTPEPTPVIKTIPASSPEKGSSIVGTVWKRDHSNRNHEYYDAIQFHDNSSGTAYSVLDGEKAVITHFHYYYEKEYDGWCIYDWGRNKIYFKVEKNQLYEGFYRPTPSYPHILDPKIWNRM